LQSIFARTSNILSYKQFRYILKGLAMEIVGLFYDHLEYLTEVCYIL
jgi:hypothetical protein